MLTLFGMPGACSLAPHIALEEAGIPFQYSMIRKSHPEDRENLLKLNPMGQVPTLLFDDGTVLTQNSAILSWIAEQVPGKKLLPPPGTIEHARAQEWLSFLGTTIHPAYGPIFSPAKYVSSEANFDDVKQVTKAKLERGFEIVESRLGDGPWALGETFSVVDPYLYVFFSWIGVPGIDAAKYPKIQRHAEALRARESAKRAFATEKIR
ncbi:glutathione S-transferase N-terminal domain-containing protein [Vulgatibacter incomptus]|uniref:Glutathione S-transferase n=1 Tax=Vulgatibacter incomptus TaxID=1391653 RepID=A0A0K1PIE0_9BACT|nr:glutathione S-transferase N-terminal domain-containing protein [Vulgatibacter incomptus]AKU93280.1 Glutathione S-transferase [Vulgatibacter incomptus]